MASWNSYGTCYCESTEKFQTCTDLTNINAYENWVIYDDRGENPSWDEDATRATEGTEPRFEVTGYGDCGDYAEMVISAISSGY